MHKHAQFNIYVAETPHCLFYQFINGVEWLQAASDRQIDRQVVWSQLADSHEFFASQINLVDNRHDDFFNRFMEGVAIINIIVKPAQLPETEIDIVGIPRIFSNVATESTDL